MAGPDPRIARRQEAALRRAPARARRIHAALAVLVLLPCVAPGGPGGPGGGEDPAGAALRSRLETHLASRRGELERLPAHLGLVGPVDSDRLVAALAEVRVHRSGDGHAIGSALEPEPHGAGVLALLLDHWRPRGRAARLDDRFLFVPDRRRISLRSLYEGYKRQLFLPPREGVASPGGAVPTATARLPRMRFRFPEEGPIVETDSYALLDLLIAEEDDPGRTWRNHRGQLLSVDRVMEEVRDHYLHEEGQAGVDHTSLHRVALLLAHHRRSPGRVDPGRIQDRFLVASVGRRDRSDLTVPWTETLGHDVESLGLLAASPGVRWTPQESRRVAEWLTFLDGGPFRDLGAVPLQHQCHLLRGLRLLAESRDRWLVGPDAARATRRRVSPAARDARAAGGGRSPGRDASARWSSAGRSPGGG